MTPQSFTPVSAGLTYVTDSRVELSAYYTSVRVTPTLVQQAHNADPLGFSYQRYLAGEADADAGRTRSLGDVMDGLRRRVRGNGG